jgi:hypothetical protein
VFLCNARFPQGLQPVLPRMDRQAIGDLRPALRDLAGQEP